MSDIYSNIEVITKSLTEIRQKAEELDNTVQELQNSKSVLTLLPYIQGKLYRPIKVFYQPDKCNKCDKNGFIPVPDNFYSRYKLCDCRKKYYEYVIQELSVISTSYIDDTGIKTYDCVYDENNLISVNENYVYKEFSKEHLDLDDSLIYYVDERDCNEFRRIKNNEEF